MSEPASSRREVGGEIRVSPSFKIPKPQEADKGQCGVLMPFGGLFDEIYNQELSSAITDAGFKPLRADEMWKTRRLWMTSLT